MDIIICSKKGLLMICNKNNQFLFRIYASYVQVDKRRTEITMKSNKDFFTL